MNTTHCPPATTQPCSACGQTQCLCRPRFFAGQLLTDADLNALQNYMIEKQKRHNRFLHGWGVVCGLQVACNPCPGWLTVGAGYAVGPCGEEIDVPCDYPLNLCDLIRACRSKRGRDYSCDPFAPPTAPATEQVKDYWYVTLRYAETEGRGIAALRSTPACARCASGSSCRCGVNPVNGKNGCQTATPPPSRPGDCEATRICEGYVIDIAPAPDPATESVTLLSLLHGTMMEQLLKCATATESIKLLYPPANVAADDRARTSKFYQAYLDLRKAVGDDIKANSDPACKPQDQLPALIPPIGPNQDSQQYETTLTAAADALKVLQVQSRLQCECSAILPPCPAEVDDPRLILACVTTQGPDCKIVDICNLRGRRQLVTIPALLYWTSAFPLLWKLIEYRCCGLAALDRFAALERDPRRMANVAATGGASTLTTLQALLLKTLEASLAGLIGDTSSLTSTRQ